MKKLLAALLCSALLVLTACGGGGLTTADAETYLRGLLNATYRGEFDPGWLELVDYTEDEARADYEAGLELEYQYFSSFFAFDEDRLTDQTRSEVKALLAELYQSARVEILSVSVSGEGFLAEVKVQPIDLIAEVSANRMEAYAEEFLAKYAHTDQAAFDALSGSAQEKFLTDYENDWAMGIAELLRACLPELDYREAVTLPVRFLPDEEGLFSIPETDFAHLDALVLAYE